MKNTKRTVMEMYGVSYIEKPNAIRKFLQSGFSIDEIQVTRIDACHYDIHATRYN